MYSYAPGAYEYILIVLIHWTLGRFVVRGWGRMSMPQR